MADETTARPQLHLFNSMTKMKEPFVPCVEGKVSMYVCGITPYDYSHIGHARAYVTFDVLYRYLKFLGYEVVYVRNFTDIDDKIIDRSNQAGETVTSFSGRFINEFLVDMTELQCLPPTFEPRVTEHIEQIIQLIIKFIWKEVGSQSCWFTGCCQYKKAEPCRLRIMEGNFEALIFTVNSCTLSRCLSFVNYCVQAAKEGEPFWESPWGRGRPGWHIECSAMSDHYMGHVFDIHGGGKDLIFPHHENELAQSRAAYSESEVKCWMHNGFVNKDDQKMSKSDNNFFTIRDIIALYHPMALRFFLMRTHYRSDVNHSDKALEIASDRVYYIYQTLYDCDEVLSLYREDYIFSSVPTEVEKLVDEHNKAFLKSMSDDLRTTDVLDGFMDLLKEINSNLNDLKKLQQKLGQQKKQQKQKQQGPNKRPENYIQALIALQGEIKNKLSILGLMPPSSLAEVLKQLKDKALKRAGFTEETLNERIEQRAAARNNRQFEVSDQIRKELASLGIALMDEPTGTVWRPCEPEQSEEV